MANVILMLLRSLLTGFRSQAVMQAEIIALRHQLIVLQRTQKTKRLILGSGRSLSLGLALTLVVALALCPDHCQTGNRHRLASSGISVVLDLEDSPRLIRTSPCFERNSRSDSNHES